jgi:tetratricopeptide (TPR) repeat protein
VKSSLKQQIRFEIVALVGLQTAPARAADGRVREPAGSKTAPKPPKQETEVIHLRPGMLPYVSLTGDIFFRILASEIAAQRGMYGTAGNTILGLARESGNPRIARRAAEFFLAASNLPSGLEATRVWAQLAPDDAEAVSIELALAAASGQTKGLSDILRRRIDTATDMPVAIYQALAVLSRLSDCRQALAIFDESLSDRARKLLAARLALTDVSYAAGDYERALRESRRALEADPKSEAAIQRVLEYGAKIDSAKAQNEARAYIARHSDSRKLRLMLAAQLADQGNYVDTLNELEAMSRRAPEDFDLLFMRAQLAYKAGQPDMSRSLLEQYLQVQEQRQQAAVPGATDAGAVAADAHVMLSRIAEEQGRYDEAIAQLARIDDPAMQYSALMRQATLRAKQGQIDAALGMIDQANAQDDEERMIGVLSKAQILRDAQRLPQAVSVLEEADRAMPDVFEIKYELAMLYERQGKIGAMERLLSQAIKLEPDNPHAYNALGHTFADMNTRLSDAQDLITQALELAPDDSFILDSMEWVKFRMKDYHAAVEYLQRAFTQKPSPEIALHLVEVLWVQGKKDDAMQLMRDVLLKDPQQPEALFLVKRLGLPL